MMTSTLSDEAAFEEWHEDYCIENCPTKVMEEIAWLASRENLQPIKSKCGCKVKDGGIIHCHQHSTGHVKELEKELQDAYRQGMLRAAERVSGNCQCKKIPSGESCGRAICVWCSTAEAIRKEAKNE